MPKEAEQLKSILTNYNIIMLGSIRQELLSGIKSTKQFEKLRSYLRSFPDLSIDSKVYELAAEYYNICRSKGVQGSNTDFLICAASVVSDSCIFTSDKDFKKYSKYLPIKLLTNTVS